MMKLSNIKRNSLILLSCFIFTACSESDLSNESEPNKDDKNITQECKLCNATTPSADHSLSSKKRTNEIVILPFYKEKSFTPQWLNPNDNSLENFHSVPAFSLTNQANQTFTKANVEGKAYVVSFFFTSCPGICPQMMRNMSAIQEAFLDDDDFLLISHTVTPDTDTPDILTNYANKHGVKSDKWHLLTGDRKVIYNLGRKVYFIEEDLGEDKTDDEFLHTENIVLVDKNGHLRGIYNGINKTSVRQLIDDVILLKKE